MGSEQHLQDAADFQAKRKSEMPDRVVRAFPITEPISTVPFPLLTKKESVLQEAEQIINGPRRANYGHPLLNHQRTADFYSTYLGIPITAEQVCMLNILQKISRSMNKLERDNLVDIAGYSANIDIIQQHREEIAKEAPL